MSMNKYKKRLLLRCIQHFKSDLINNMDHMPINKRCRTRLKTRDWVLPLAKQPLNQMSYVDLRIEGNYVTPGVL